MPWENRDEFGLNKSEERFLKELKEIGLKPIAQYRISDMTVDFAFPNVKLVLELDGPHHQEKEEREKDKRRDHVLGEFGWIVMHITTASIYHTPIETVQYINDVYSYLAKNKIKTKDKEDEDSEESSKIILIKRNRTISQFLIDGSEWFSQFSQRLLDVSGNLKDISYKYIPWTFWILIIFGISWFFIGKKTFYPTLIITSSCLFGFNIVLLIIAYILEGISILFRLISGFLRWVFNNRRVIVILIALFLILFILITIFIAFKQNMLYHEFASEYGKNIDDSYLKLFYRVNLGSDIDQFYTLYDKLEAKQAVEMTNKTEIKYDTYFLITQIKQPNTSLIIIFAWQNKTLASKGLYNEYHLIYSEPNINRTS
jgi:very-short-patch-repair endonuclease